MKSNARSKVDSEYFASFAEKINNKSFNDYAPKQDKGVSSGRLNLDADKVKNGLGQLVLTLVKLLHDLLERQAIRRIDSDSLSDAEIEKLGMTLMQQAEEIDRLRLEFGLDDDDLNLDLGPLGKLL